MEHSIKVLQRAINGAKYIVALTGAGISTSAGIPDFRGKKGIYSMGLYDPYKTFDYSYFIKDPYYFFNFAKDFARLYDKITPTKGHKFLAELEKAGKLKAVITQNIDGLHQIAGSKNVVEVHGGFTEGHCTGCEKEYKLEWMKNELLEKGELKCSCGSWVKPDIVFFGEPVFGMRLAKHYTMMADLLLVIGSSLTVTPAASLPYLTEGRIIVINKGEVALPKSSIYLRIDSDIDSVAEKLKIY